MYDPSFNNTSLSRHLHKSDFKKYAALFSPAHKANVIASSVSWAKTGFLSLSLTSEDLAGRTIFQLSNLSEELVLRKATQNLKKISRIKPSDRVSIIKRLRLFCEEGTSFSIAKFDIKNFFASVNTEQLETQLARSLSTSPATELVLRTFLQQCRASNILGLPPGIPVSAALSEFLLRDFDDFFRNETSVLFYARYVDDIVMVLNPNTSICLFRQTLIERLPTGLHLNAKKTRMKLLKSFDKNHQDFLEWGFEYLGYKFEVNTISSKIRFRNVKLDIGKSKIKVRKTRVVLAFRQFLSDGSFDDLIARIRIITGNYRFLDHRKGKIRSAGNRHIYSLIDQPANSLVELDRFLKGIVLHGQGKVSGPLRLSLSHSQKTKILEHSFVAGFQNSVHFSFKPEDLKRLMECWKYA